MLDTVFGLPVHPLVVHATVVIVPAAALAVGLAAIWPRFRRWAGLLPLALAAAAVVLVPISTQSGEALAERVGEGGLVERHEDLGRGLLPWVLLLLLGAVLLYVSDRRTTSRPSGGAPSTGSRVLAVSAVVVSLVAAAGTTVQVALIGHSGATAAWSSVVESTDGAIDD